MLKVRVRVRPDMLCAMQLWDSQEEYRRVLHKKYAEAQK